MLKQGLTVFQNSFIYQTDEFAIKGEECDPKKDVCKKSHQSCRDEDGDGYWHCTCDEGFWVQNQDDGHCVKSKLITLLDPKGMGGWHSA